MRARRRHDKARRAAARARLLRHLGTTSIGCPDGRACPFCRVPRLRAARRREDRAEITEQLP